MNKPISQTFSPKRPSVFSRIFLFLSLTALTLTTTLPLAAAPDSADWSSWRGPQQDGRITAGLLTEEPFELEVVWQRELGSGYSAISVVGDQALTMYGDGEDDLLVALKTSNGEEIWRYRLGPMTPGGNGSDAGPLSTPVSDGETVFVTGSDTKLHAVRLRDGQAAWTVALKDAVGAEQPFFGFTSTPLISGDLVIVQAGGAEAGVVALDRASGEVRWKAAAGKVDYRSPILGTLAGREQVIAPFAEKTFGLDPATGEILWSLDYESAGSVTPLIVAEDRLLLTGRTEAVLFQIPEQISKNPTPENAPTELWRNSDFKRTFATPVLHQGKLYGFNRAFLTAVDVETGERLWRSRPPGGRGLILVDGHLAIFGNDGRLVLVDTDGGGYAEAAHVSVAELGSYTSPSVAGGLLFVRDLERIAAVRVRAATPIEEVTEEPSNAFEVFVRKVETSQDPASLVKQFLNDTESFPIVEDQLLHFVYHGEAEDVALRGTMLDFGREVQMQQAKAGDLFYYTVEVPPNGRWEYQYIVDFENRMSDPLNPRTVPGNNGSGELSEINLTGREASDFLAPYEGKRPGRVESFELDSQILENQREVTVYLPHGYSADQEPLPFVLFHQGPEWLEGAAIVNTLNHLMEDGTAPFVGVFIEMPRRASSNELLGRRAEDYAKMLHTELDAILTEKYGTPSRRISVGKGDGAVAALHTALRHPEVFSQAIVLSYAEPSRLSDALQELMSNSSAETRAQFAVHWNRDDFRSRAEGWDIPAETKALMQTLQDHGFKVTGGEAIDGGGWGSWRVQIAEALKSALQ